MARMKKPVDGSPICDAAYLRQIDPVWIPGPVPRHFWEDVANRRDYLLWLGHKLRFRCMEDWYRLTAKDVAENRGSRLLRYWQSSAIEAVKECFPQYDWKEWLFPHAPAGFWEQRSNCRRYLDWLGAKLGYRCLDDWYGVSFWDFERNKGTMLVNGHQGSPALVVTGLIPRCEWCEWKFLHVPPGFWEVTENRHRYLRWLGRELGLRRRTDWYRVHVDDIKAHFGEGLCGLWSLYELLSDFLPQLDWDRQNRSKPLGVDQILQWADAFFAEHGEWPMCSSGPVAGTNTTWSAINDRLRGGLRGLPGGGSLAKFLQKHRGVRVGRTPPALSEDQVLAWADAYFAAHRKWPVRASGPIAGTRENWSAIASAMHKGGRGFRRGSSLSQLLAQRRGVRNAASLPPLNEERILAWAKAHFKATSRWPIDRSGAIAESPGDTWCAVNQALSKGRRGLDGDSSLARLLRKHGLK